MTATMDDAAIGIAAEAPSIGIAARAIRRLRALTRAERVAYGATCIYAAVFTVFAFVRYLDFQSQRFDLGNMTQAVWSTLHGRFLEGTTQNGEQITRLAYHVDPILALFAPLWWVWPSPIMLLVVQSLAVSAGAMPVFWLARKHLGSERLAGFLAIGYLLYPATQGNAFSVDSGFHPVSLAVPLLLLAIWFLDEDRLLAFTVVGILAAATKEEIPLVVGLVGLWYAITRRRWRFGLPVFAVGAALTVLNFLYVIPHFLGSNTPFGGRYAAVGGTPKGILRHAVTDPSALVHQVASVHKLVYVVLLVVPFLGLWLLEPLLALAAVPDLAINLLSNTPAQSGINYHYTAGIVPVLVAGSILGLARLRRFAPRGALYSLAAITCTAVVSPLYMGSQHVAEALPSNPIHRVKAHALALIPRGAPVAASNQLGAYLSARRRIMLFPFAIEDARWIVVDRDDPTYSDEAAYARRVQALSADPRWRLVYSSHGVLVFRRRA